jgi:hypothetical protein
MSAHDYTVEFDYLTGGAISATATPDGSLVAIDFVLLHDPSMAVRLAVPAEKLESLTNALLQIQKALDDPESGIHIRPSH